MQLMDSEEFITILITDQFLKFMACILSYLLVHLNYCPIYSMHTHVN